MRRNPRIPRGNLVPKTGVTTVMTQSLRRTAVLALLVFAGLPFGAEFATADCIGPTVGNTGGDLAHGEFITVTGYGFGDNCYDTGPPPPGEGSLGMPLSGIEVYFDQGGQRHLVATGNSGQDYAWEVQVPIPAVLDIGEAQVVVMSNGSEAFYENKTAIWVTSEREEAASITVATFGPERLDEPDAAPEPGFQGTNWTPVIVLVATTAAVVGVLALHQRRSTR